MMMMMIRVPWLSPVFDEREGGGGGAQKAGKISDASVSRLLKCPLKLLLLLFLLPRLEWLGAFSPRRRRPHLGRHDGQPICVPPQLSPNKKGWRATFQRGLLPRRMNFSLISSLDDEASEGQREGCVSRRMARRWISRGVTTFEEEEEWQMTFRYIVSFSFFSLSNFSSK